jgi:hypothetical protein
MTRAMLEVGQPPLEIAGVRLRAMRIEDGLALEIANATGSTIAYHVVTTAAPVGCDAAPARLFNAMTIRSEWSRDPGGCAWHAGIAPAAVRVETVEVLPLSAWYLDQVPPSAVGIEPRIARGHRPPETGAPLRVRAAASGAKWARTRRNWVERSHRLLRPPPLPDLPIFPFM